MKLQQNISILFCASLFKDEFFFHKMIRHFLKKLYSYHPFNNLIDVDFINIYTSFCLDFNSANLKTKNVHNIDLNLDEMSKKITINVRKLSEKLESIRLNAKQFGHNRRLFQKELNHNSLFLLIFLLPSQGDGGFENEFGDAVDEEFYFIATSCDDNWEQLIIRSLCKIMSLGDEFELNEPAFEHPSRGTGELLDEFHPNLIYLDTPLSSVPAKDTKWRMLGNKPGFDFPIRKAPSHPTKADLSIPAHNFLPSGIELWEGGGGYRTKIYRSAHDCLMRREIGNKNLPVRAAEVPLCPVCAAYMQHKILEFGRENREPSLEFRGFIQQL